MAKNPLSLDVQTKYIILNNIKNYVPYEYACYKAGVSEKKLVEWIKQGDDDLDDGLDTIYADFVVELRSIHADQSAELLNGLKKRRKALIIDRYPPLRKYFGKYADEIEELNRKIVEIRQMVENKR